MLVALPRPPHSPATPAAPSALVLLSSACSQAFPQCNSCAVFACLLVWLCACCISLTSRVVADACSAPVAGVARPVAAGNAIACTLLTRCSSVSCTLCSPRSCESRWQQGATLRASDAAEKRAARGIVERTCTRRSTFRAANTLADPAPQTPCTSARCRWSVGIKRSTSSRCGER